MVRAMLLYHVRDLDDPRRRVIEARAFLEFLAREATPLDENYAQVLKQESELLGREDDSYFLHEHLDEVNHPLYFREFVAHAAASGLRYLAPAQPSARDASLAPWVQETLDRLGTDRIRREQYLDFVRNRTFRQSLLCHGGRTLCAGTTAEVVAGLRMVALASPESAAPDLGPGAAEVFVSPLGGRLTTSQPLTKAALAVLSDSWPRSLTLDELRGEIRVRLGRRESEDDPHALAKAILHCHQLMMVQLHVHEPPIALEPVDRPRAAPVSRLQAEGDSLVISLRNRNVELEPFDAMVLPLLDGTRDRGAIVERLAQGVAGGTYAIRDRDGRPLEDPREVRATLAEALEPCLRRLAHQALLCDPR
jgi:methyltransferase-like protein